MTFDETQQRVVLLSIAASNLCSCEDQYYIPLHLVFGSRDEEEGHHDGYQRTECCRNK